jgi:hypothetical protein
LDAVAQAELGQDPSDVNLHGAQEHTIIGTGQCLGLAWPSQPRTSGCWQNPK